MIYCIYHGNCSDGFTAAWVVRSVYGDRGIEFLEGIYYEEPHQIPPNSDIIFVDFTYKRPVLEKMLESCHSMLILDHHKTAQEDLVGVFDNDKVSGLFDMTRSGARLAWDWFYPSMPPPPTVKIVEDQDLWKFSLPFTRELMSYILSHEYKFDVWDTLSDLLVQDEATCLIEGRAIERRQKKDVAELVKLLSHRIRILGYNIPAANLPHTLCSDAGMLLCIDELFAATYYETEEHRVFSLRSDSKGSNFDVSEVAKKFGGGGHRNASGFKISRDGVLTVGPGSRWTCEGCKQTYKYPLLLAQSLRGAPLYLKESVLRDKKNRLKPLYATYDYCEECSD